MAYDQNDGKLRFIMRKIRMPLEDEQDFLSNVSEVIKETLQPYEEKLRVAAMSIPHSDRFEHWVEEIPQKDPPHLGHFEVRKVIEVFECLCDQEFFVNAFRQTLHDLPEHSRIVITPQFQFGGSDKPGVLCPITLDPPW